MRPPRREPQPHQDAAFKTFGQRYAYYPDKTKDIFDKQNVRDGHYLPWSPTPYISDEGRGVTGLIADPLAKRFYDLVVGNVVETTSTASASSPRAGSSRSAR